MLLEVCVDSLESAKNAILGGADRLELCSSLAEDGLTPSAGLFSGVKNELTNNTKTKLFCMIRIRNSHFFSEEEITSMINDVNYFKANGADGIVFGALTDDFQIDIESCKRIMSAWGEENPATFHRAFDQTKIEEIEKNIKIIKEIGFSRILTSGLEETAEKGVENLKKIEKIARNLNLIVMPGAGVNSGNTEMILRETDCKEIHGSLRNENLICDRGKVEEICKILKSIKD